MWLEVHFWLFSSGFLTIEDLEITMESNGTNIRLNITYISTGEPATNVTWTRFPNNATVTEGIETVSVLDDRVTAQYTHTLTATESSSSLFKYQCEVSNNKPSSFAERVQIHFPGNGMLLDLWHKVWIFILKLVKIWFVCFLGDNLNHPICISHIHVYIHYTIPASASCLPLRYFSNWKFHYKNSCCNACWGTCNNSTTSLFILH